MSYLSVNVNVEIPYRDINDDDLLDLMYHGLKRIRRRLSTNPPCGVSSSLIELYEELGPLLRYRGLIQGSPPTLEDEFKVKLLRQAHEQMSLVQLEEVLLPHLK